MIKKNPALRDDYTDNSFLLEKTQESAKDFKALQIRPEDRNKDFETSGFIYNTAIVNNILQRIKDGDRDVDLSPFYQGDPDLRGPNVSFQMTAEEEKEWTKCFLDPIYFVSEYCKFKTDKGWRTVDLYDFQEEIIETATKTRYDEELDLFVPENRNIVLCASRQVGKCLSDAVVTVRDENGTREEDISRIFDIYDRLPKKNNFLHKVLRRIKNISDKIYNTIAGPFEYIVKYITGYIIEGIERYEINGRPIVDDKFIRCVIPNDIQVKTDNGYSDILAVWKTKPYKVYRVEFADGTFIEGADTHIVLTPDLKEVYIKDLREGDILKGDKGNKVVDKIIKYPFKRCMYDMYINSPEHTYYTNGILSHNTTTTVCILTYYLCFSNDKNIAVMANKLATSKEIVDKLINVFKGLPYFLKPGCLNFGATYIKLDNGCRVLANSTTKSTSIGFTIDILYLDEFAHVPPNVGYEFWRSVIPTLASLKTSQCIISSTPNGVSNKFFEVWDGAMKHENSYKPIKVEWWRVPGRDEKWAEQMKRDFGEEAFAQEFDLQFHVNSMNLVKSSDLTFMRRIGKEYKTMDFIGLDKSLSDNLYWSPCFDPTTVTEHDYFILSVDTAEGRDVDIQSTKDSDYNVVNIFKVVPMSNASIYRRQSMTRQYADCFRLQQVGIYVDRNVNEEGAATVAKFVTFDLFHCGRGTYDNVRVLIEMNFNGRNFINVFNTHRNYYPAIVLSTYHTKYIPGEMQRKKLGYKTTPGNRDYFLKNGASLIGSRNIIVDQHNKSDMNISSIVQLENFGKLNGKYQGISVHDDIAMTVLNLSRLWDINAYNNFLEDYIDYHLDIKEKNRIEYALKSGSAYYDDSEDALNSMYNVLGEYTEQMGMMENGGSPYGLGNVSSPYSAGNTGSPYTSGNVSSPYGSGNISSPY